MPTGSALRRLGRMLGLVACLALVGGGAGADDGAVLGPARGKIDIFPRPTLELVQALLTLAGMPTARAGDRTLAGMLQLGTASVPVTGRIVERGIDKMPYFDLAVPIEQLAARSAAGTRFRAASRRP